jgi:hypothetical protein
MDKLDQLSDVFFNWQVLLIAFSAFAVVSVLRQLGTKKDKDGAIIGGWAEGKFFKVFLLVLPYLLTCGLVFVPGVPLPEVVTKAAPKLMAVKVLYGIYAGWLSDKSYQVVKKVLEKFGIIAEK